jgi:hypothetical protein
LATKKKASANSRPASQTLKSELSLNLSGFKIKNSSKCEQSLAKIELQGWRAIG